jgi:GntR family transcriptional regulator
MIKLGVDMLNDHKIQTGVIPKYRQLLQILRNQIHSGELPPGAQIPTEEELVANYKVSRGTVRKAITQLEAEKLIDKIHGVGSFVRPVHSRAIPFHFVDLRSIPEFSGGTVTYKVLDQEVIPAPMDVAEKLSISPGDRAIHVERLHLVEKEVMAYSVRYLPEPLCPSLLKADLTRQSIHELLVANSELPLLRTEFEIEAHSMNEEEANLLQAQVGKPAIVVNRLTFTAPNRPAVWYRALYKYSYYLGVEVGDITPG